VLVELDIFSGRTNPRWRLDAKIASRLNELHHSLPQTTESPPEPPGLGYRGFIYVLDEITWRAWKGFIVGSDRALVDTARVIERLLLNQLPTEYRDLRPRIAADLSSGFT
jgi:hypothetical protein